METVTTAGRLSGLKEFVTSPRTRLITIKLRTRTATYTIKPGETLDVTFETFRDIDGLELGIRYA